MNATTCKRCHGYADVERDDGTMLIQIAVVGGAEGASLQVWGRDGGERVSGPKAWGNPYNKPSHLFTLDADELCKVIAANAYTEDTQAEEVSHE